MSLAMTTGELQSNSQDRLRICGPDPIVIVGNGPAGMQCLVQLRRLGVETPVLLFGKENWLPYDRVKLSSFLAGTTTFDALANCPKELDESVSHFVGRAIVSIDVHRKKVIDSTGVEHGYARLVLALGSRAHVPDVDGIHLSGVFRFRDMKDAQQLMARTARSRHTMVIGGGLLGIEAARGLRRRNTEVTLVQHSETLMNRQLDVDAAEMVRTALEEEGVVVQLQTSIKRIKGHLRVESVELMDGTCVECDSVVFATGITPSSELAREAGIRVAQGIRVDEFMRTSARNVYAIGECAQFGQHISGLVAPGLQQAMTAAAHIAGEQKAYTPSADTTWLKVLSLEVFSAGQFRNEDRFQIHRSVVYRNRKKGIYRRILLRAGRVVGMVSIGEWPERTRVLGLLKEKRWLLPWQILHFRISGRLGGSNTDEPVANWPENEIVCQCKALTRGELSAVLPDCEQNVDDLKKRTGAATVCGGCEPLLDNLCGARQSSTRKIPGAMGLSISGLVGLIALACAVYLPLPDIAESVTRQSLFEVWSRDGQLRQWSGYSLLATSVLILLLSLRKRIAWLSFGAFSYWRIAHAVLGVSTVGVLFWHTGFSFGENLNRWLMTSFVLVIAWGCIAAAMAWMEEKTAGRWLANIRRKTTWLHILVFWPLPVLLTFHIVAAYYF